MLSDSLKVERRQRSLTGMLKLLVVFLLSVAALRLASDNVDTVQADTLVPVTLEVKVALLGD